MSAMRTIIHACDERAGAIGLLAGTVTSLARLASVLTRAAAFFFAARGAEAAYPPGRLIPTILSTFLLTKSKWARTVLFADSLVTDRLRRAGEGLPHPAAQTEEIEAIKVQRVLNFFSRRIRLRLRLRVPRLRAP